ncbi:PIF1 helicase [Zea mays]|nr:PIF1 helicase [Zea mays]
MVYHSFDSAMDDPHNYYPPEFLNTLTPNGLPPHVLKLKIGCPVILLRNIDPANGLCNGTRLVVRGFQRNSIDTEIVLGQYAGKRIFLPRIPLCPSDDEIFPFQFKRKQFPIRLSFAMTVNKAQGQTIPNVGVYLPEPVFSHGQLYVALSRATARLNIKILAIPAVDGKKRSRKGVRKNPTVDCGTYTKNIVYKEGGKNIIKFEGDHNSPRPQSYYDSVFIFFYKSLHPPLLSAARSKLHMGAFKIGLLVDVSKTYVTYAIKFVKLHDVGYLSDWKTKKACNYFFFVPICEAVAGGEMNSCYWYFNCSRTVPTCDLLNLHALKRFGDQANKHRSKIFNNSLPCMSDHDVQHHNDEPDYMVVAVPFSEQIMSGECKLVRSASCCDCREIMWKIMEQVKAESDQWTEMQDMLEQAAAIITLLFIIALNLAIGILPHVDNFAHIGGFATGFLLGFVLLARPQFSWMESHELPHTNQPPKYKAYKYILWVVALVLLLVGFVISLVMLFKGKNGMAAIGATT